MANLKTYSFLDSQGAIAGPGAAFALASDTGIADEGIDIESANDIDTLTMSADGSGMHNLHADKSGKITVRVLKTSPLNGLLAAAYALQTSRASLHGQNTISWADARGESVTCEQCAFLRAPTIKYAKDGGLNEWTFNAVRITRIMPLA